MATKVFVLDTNVILHDSDCLYQFDEHDIVIPMAVLEELDQFKKGDAALNFHARAFVRELDQLSGDKLFDGGLPIGTGLGRIAVKLDSPIDPDLGTCFNAHKPDQRILNTAVTLHKQRDGRQVILVSKDVNLRMKAKAANITAQDYTTDHVTVSALSPGYRVVEEVDPAAITRLYSDPAAMPIAELDLAKPAVPN